MSCGVRNEWRTNQDVETVNAAFAFIYDESNSGSSSPIPDDECTLDVDNVDVVLDEHFSFLNNLNDSDCQVSIDQPIYANLCSSSCFRNEIPETVSSNPHEVIGTPQKLDIHVSKIGTNFHNGNTIINIPCESEHPLEVIHTDPDSSSYSNHNYVTVCLDLPENLQANFQSEKDIQNDGNDSFTTDEFYTLSENDLLAAVSQNISDMKQFNSNEQCDQSSIEMDPVNDSIYVEPNFLSVTPTIEDPEKLANSDIEIDCKTNKLYLPPIAIDDTDNEVNLIQSEQYCGHYDIRESSSLETVKTDIPRPVDLPQHDQNMKHLDSSCDSASAREEVEAFIEAKNDLFEDNLNPSLEIVSKDISDSAATHYKILLCLDKEVESIDCQCSDACVDDITVDSLTINRDINLSDKNNIAEALNPNVLCEELDDISIVQPIIDDEQEIVPLSNLDESAESVLSLPIEHSLSFAEPDHTTDVNDHQTSIIFNNDNRRVPQRSLSNKDSPSEASKVTDDDSLENVGFAASIGRAIRLSMRRMRQIRLSGRRSKRTPSEAYAYYNEGVVSEETEGRRDMPEAPPVGLPSVRSPAASAVILPAILAALGSSNQPTEEPSSEAHDVDSDFLSSQSIESSIGHNFNRSDSESSQHSGHLTEEGRQQDPTSSPPPVYSATQGSSSLSALRSAGEAELLVHNQSLVDNSQSRSSRNRTRRCSLEHAAAGGQNFGNHLSRENLVQTDVPPVSTVVSNRSQSTARSISRSSLDTTSDPSLLNERRGQSRRSSPSRQSSQSSSNISGFRSPKREFWPHSFSGLLTALPLTLNVFNISRFALFGAKYGWQFPIQWGIISLVFGLPLMVFHMAVGQLVGAGPIDMWVISPIFQGVGFGVLIAEALLGVYCCIPIAWMFTYFRESFDMRTFRCITSYDCDNAHNLSAEINQVVPQFFVSNILARSVSPGVPLANLGTIHFNLAFNLLVIWIILFIALSRGAKTLGKICYLSTLLPFICFNGVCCYLIYIAFTQLPVISFFPKFLDKQSWMVAAREAFLVWALHGAALQQIAAGNRKGHPLWRDTTIIALLTGSGLFLAAFCGIVCSTVLHEKSLRFSPSSFETADTRRITEVRNWISKYDTAYGLNKASHIYDMFTPQDVYDNFYVGVRIRKQFLDSDVDSNRIRSGYNSIRFLTEMFPALLFTLRSPIEAVIPPIFYLSLLMFGLAHQISVWFAVIQGVIRMQYKRLRAIETFLTFCCCVFGFSAALPLATGAGMNVLYFLDFIVGSAWWLMILQLIYIFGILLVRGKPFSASDISSELFGGKGWLCGLRYSLCLCWTVLIPVGLVVATISSFQSGDYRQVFTWECSDWPVWVCQLASALQLFPLLLVPLFGIVKTCIFLSHPRHNFMQKLEFLYRPPPFRDIYQEDDPFLNEDPDDSLDLFRGELINQQNRRHNQAAFNDPPPKYTPPPSYSTATGSSFAKTLENTVRRSFRYLRRHPSRTAHSQLPP